MNWCLFIIGIVLFGIGLLCILRISYKSKSKLSEGAMLFVMLLLLGVILIIEGTDTSPSLIDVYRGKTDLQITYKVVGADTLQRDTLVVWRK